MGAADGGFCQRVLAQLRHATPDERAQVARELEAHLEDHAQALREAGCGEEEALARAEETMGDPEAVGRALDKNYPLGWLLLSRAALTLTILLCIALFFCLPLLGNLYSSVATRLSPERSGFSPKTPDSYSVVRALDLRAQAGSDVLRVYQVAIIPTAGDSTLASVTLCNYDRSPFGIASQSLSSDIRVEVDSAGDRYFGGGGGGNAGAIHCTKREIAVRRTDTVITLRYEEFGCHIAIEVPLPWEEMP